MNGKISIERTDHGHGVAISYVNATDTGKRRCILSVDPNESPETLLAKVQQFATDMRWVSDARRGAKP